MEPKECPKFDYCNSNLCPIDPGLSLRKYFDEGVCFYVRQYLKIEAGMTDALKLKEVEKAIIEAVPKQIDLMRKIGGAKYRYKLDRAARHKSKSQAKFSREQDHTILRGPVTENEGSHSKEKEVA